MPTREALVLLQRARFILFYIDQRRLEMLASHAKPPGPITLGMSPALAALLSLPLAQGIRALPGYPAEDRRDVRPALYAQLVEGDVDVAILSGPSRRDTRRRCRCSSSVSARSAPPTTRHSGCASSASDSSAASRSSSRIPKSGIRLELEVAARKAGVELDQVMEVESLEVARRLVAEGVGWTVHFATPIKRELDDGTLAARPIRGLRLERFVARGLERPPSRATEVVMALLQESAVGLVAGGDWPNAVLSPSRA